MHKCYQNTSTKLCSLTAGVCESILLERIINQRFLNFFQLGSRSVGCFTVRDGTDILQQACYSNQEMRHFFGSSTVSVQKRCRELSNSSHLQIVLFVLSARKKRVCSSGRKHRGISLCCCFGPRCNASV